MKNGKVELRKLVPTDAHRLVELANNEKVSINLRDTFQYPYSIRDARKFIKMVNNSDTITAFAIEYQGEYVGNIALITGNDVYRRSAEIGYFLGESYWNKGIMTLAIDLITDFGFDKLELLRIHAGVFENNKSSKRVLEKCGFVNEGISRSAVYKNEQVFDEFRFAKLNPRLKDII